MKPILALWLAVLALLCLWICLEPGSGSGNSEKVVKKATPWREATPVAMVSPAAAPLMAPAVAGLHP